MKTFLKKNLILILSLAIVLSFNITSESSAEVINCVNGKYDDGTTCEKCGDKCNWSYDTTSRKLTVSGSGDMYDYESQEIDGVPYTTAPWSTYTKKIKAVEVLGLSSIGKHSFSYTYQLEDAKISDSVQKIGQHGFWVAGSLASIILPDSLKTMETDAFGWAPLTKIVLPDTLETFERRNLGVFFDKGNYDNVEIVCRGTDESCKNLRNLLKNYEYYGSGGYKKMDISGKLVLADYKTCTSTNYFWDGAKCVREPDATKRKCCASCKDMGGYCNRIRYTPAEAAEVLKDNNTNSVTITFKK